MILLIELIIVRLSRSETISKSTTLGLAAVLMIVLRYSGEVSDDIESTRFIWDALSMIPFLYIIYTLYVGLGEAISRQPDDVKGLVSLAQNVTVFSWLFYSISYFAPFTPFIQGSGSFMVIEVGYTIADIIAKAAFGVLIYMIAVRKSEAQQYGTAAAN